jgi:pimeloyl-ACP methyl ester carboxylesterase
MKKKITPIVLAFCFITSLALAQSETSTTINQLIDIGAGRSLYLECVGNGSPTVIVEPGEGASHSAMNVVRDALKQTYQVCSYDRSNIGQSSSVPTPRTAQDIVDDLAALLSAAQVPPPYLLVGSSAGGTFVQLYSAKHPEQVMGVLAMNAVPPAEGWFDEALPLMTEDEQKEEYAYFQGANGEAIDYETSSSQILEAGLPPMPFAVMISTIAQCGSPDDICGRTYGVYTEAERAIADLAPQGKFVEVEAGHDIFMDDLDAVVTAIESLAKQ